MAIAECSSGRLKHHVDDFERRLIVAALAAAGWNQRGAARSLGVLPTTLNSKIKRLGIPSKPGALVEVSERLAQPEPDGREEFEWEGRLAKGQTLEIDGVSGSLRAEVATSDTVRLVATKIGPAVLRGQTAIKVTASRRGVVVLATSAAGDGGTDRGAPVTAARVDVVVRVPTGVRLLIHRPDGHLEIAGVAGTIEVPAAPIPFEPTAFEPGKAPKAALRTAEPLRLRRQA